jgi:hypothetical protein
MKEFDTPQPIDIVIRLRQTRAEMIGTDDEQHYWDCHDAADEIVSLRVLLKRQSEAAHQAVTMMGRYAERYGFLLGGLEMVAIGHTTAERVLRCARDKYPEDPASTPQVARRTHKNRSGETWTLRTRKARPSRLLHPLVLSRWRGLSGRHLSAIRLAMRQSSSGTNLQSKCA